ncbi:hypothetical protein AURDEDRAFT_113825 [Auricularia subglabra TFB-10046 SS5]|nr:hypothetical protein AURDEDRAFT_113825 [Auricularia subglabra TFB-10046 SS5]
MLASCIGVFYLLKTRKGGGNPRKRMGHTRDVETSSGPSVVGGTVEMSFPSQGRFAGTFGGRGRSGWGRADSAEYDPVETADIVDEAGARYRDYKRTLDTAGGDAAGARHLRQDSASSSASTIRLDAPASPTDKADGPKTIGGSAEHPRYSQHVEPNGRRRATDESTLVSPTSIAHPLGVGGSKFHEMIT